MLELAGGLADLAAEQRVVVAGGDVTAAPVLLVAVTVVGQGEPARLVRRAGAAPGDLVVVTGELGGAAAGLALLEHPELSGALAEPVAAALRRRQLEPVPRLAAGRALAAAGASAMIDLSDGLGADAGHLADAGGVGFAIALERVPIQGGVAEVAAAVGADSFDLAAAGGEDYELLATIAPERFEAAAQAVAATGVSLTTVGEVTGGDSVRLSDRGADRPPAGFDQLRSTASARRPRLTKWSLLRIAPATASASTSYRLSAISRFNFFNLPLSSAGSATSRFSQAASDRSALLFTLTGSTGRKRSATVRAST